MSERAPLSVDVTAPRAGMSVVDVLHAATALPRQRIKHAMQCGAVWLTRGRSTRRIRRATRTLCTDEVVHLHYDERVLAQQPPTPTLIEDAGAYSVWHKPSGMRSQGSKWGDHCTIMRWAEQHLTPQRTSFTVHRLDLPAAGLIVVAHSKTAAADLARQFRERRVDKRYHAVVCGDCRGWAHTRTVTTPIDGKTAVTHVQCDAARSDAHQSVLHVTIETGRKHQIRRHLAELGHPIVGDRQYGQAAPDAPDLMLTAVHLAFDHPLTGQRKSYVTQPGQAAQI